MIVEFDVTSEYDATNTEETLIDSQKELVADFVRTAQHNNYTGNMQALQGVNLIGVSSMSLAPSPSPTEPPSASPTVKPSTDPIISIDCTCKYLTLSLDSTSNTSPTAPHKASCNTLELRTSSAGSLANVMLTVEVISSLPEGIGVGTTVGRGEGDGVGFVVGILVGRLYWRRR